MAKKQTISEYEKVIARLTGGVRTDKQILIEAISLLRKKGGLNSDISLLGKKLYQILLENGLNESDVINFERLANKVDVYLYEQRHDDALELLEVLDSQIYFQKQDEVGEKIYFVSNPIELAILRYAVLPQNTIDINCSISPRSDLLVMKSKIFISQNKFQEAESMLKEALSFNPVNFDAHIGLAEIVLKSKSKQRLNKFKDNITNAYKVCYNPKSFIVFLRTISKYFEEKLDYLTAYACLTCIELFENPLIVQTDLNRLNVEINKHQTELFKGLSVQDAKRILTRENVPFIINGDIIAIVLTTYQNILVYDFNNITLIEKCKDIVENLVFKSPEVVKELERKAKKMRDEINNS